MEAIELRKDYKINQIFYVYSSEFETSSTSTKGQVFYELPFCDDIKREFKTYLNNEDFWIEFTKPVLVVTCKNEDGLYEAYLEKNENLKGYGETREEAEKNLVTDIYGAWLLTEFEDNELHESAKKLKEFLYTIIKEIKEL